MVTLKILRAYNTFASGKFLRPLGNMGDLQKISFSYIHNLLLSDDADAQARWGYALMRERIKSRAKRKIFVGLFKSTTLRLIL